MLDLVYQAAMLKNRAGTRQESDIDARGEYY
jgi:hypothetical protein